MKTVIFCCDICGKEFPPREFSFLTGQLIKMDKELKAHQVAFEGHHCGDCTKNVLGYIDKLKDENTSREPPKS